MDSEKVVLPYSGYAISQLTGEKTHIPRFSTKKYEGVVKACGELLEELKGEREADEDIALGRFKTINSVEELIEELKEASGGKQSGTV